MFTTETLELEKALTAASTTEATRAAIALAARALTVAGSDSRTDRKSAVLALLAVYALLYRDGDVPGSKRALDGAVALSADLEPDLRVNVLLQAGELELLRCDVSGALSHLATGLEIAQRNAMKVEEARAWVSYAVSLQAAGLYKQADVLFDHALEVLKNYDEPRQIANIWAWRVRLKKYTDIVEFENARFACKQTLSYGERCEPHIRDQITCTALCNWAALELLGANIGEARALLARAAARPDIGIRPKWLIDLLLALADIYDQNTEDRRSVLDQLLLPENAPPRIYVIEAYSVISSLYASIGDSAHATNALISLAAERAEAFSALVRDKSIATVLPSDDTLSGSLASVDSSTITSAVLERMAITAELRDDTTGKHCFRVGRMAALLAKRAGLDAQMVTTMDLAARLHDIGKVAIPDEILLKPGRLDLAEMRLMQTHTTIGAGILNGGNDPMIRAAQRIARHHHECWDGSGYPDGLAGETIPLEARVVALADVFDALTHVRTYKAAWSRQEALTYILRKKGTHFDPQLTDIFLELIHEAETDWAAFYRNLETAADQSPFAEAQAKIARVLEEEGVAFMH